ncbi:MAG: PAS domain S-box protein [Chloroflexi bacterium]|nr:PAS domain S-box protein [Chloroflexota bacterium]
MDPLAFTLQLVFYALFAVSAWQFVRRRGPLELSVVAIFGSFVALFLLGSINSARPDLAEVIGRPVAVAVLLAQPFLVVRLLHQIRPVSRRITWLVFAGWVLSTVGILVVPDAVPELRGVTTLAVVGYFFAGEIGAATRIALEARRRFGVARIRLTLAAAGTALFGTSILLAGIASAASPQDATPAEATILTRLFAIFAGLAYLGAFVPPKPIRRFINQAAAFGLVRSLVAPETDAGIGKLWVDLASTARDILAARRVAIVPPQGDPLGVVGDEAEPIRAGVPVSNLEIAIRPGRPEGEHLIAQIEGRALFVDDDLSLIGELCDLTAKAIDRETALVSLGEARREAEETRAVRASEARFRALLEAAPAAILALDEEDRVTWATRQAGELFGTIEEELVGRPLADLVVRPREASEDEVGGRPVQRSETIGRRIDGTDFPAEMARTTFELEGRPFQLAVVSDITWRHEADQIRDRFLGVLSHELRTPVTSIYGGTQLLLGRGARLDAETRRELLTGVAAEAERLQRMIENLVAMARIERGADFGGTRPVLADRIIRQLVERERQLWPEVSIRRVADGPVQMVAADEEYLAQIMRNLLSNAAKYSGAGSTVEVVLEDGDGEVLIRVKDNGPGIAPEDADLLFRLYYRAAHHAATAPGAGIGLFVCRELVATMGGRIWATPRPEGGSEFGFSLPAYVDELEETGALPDDDLVVFEGTQGPAEKAREMPATA